MVCKSSLKVLMKGLCILMNSYQYIIISISHQAALIDKTTLYTICNTLLIGYTRGFCHYCPLSFSALYYQFWINYSIRYQSLLMRCSNCSALGCFILPLFQNFHSKLWESLTLGTQSALIFFQNFLRSSSSPTGVTPNFGLNSPFSDP